MTSEADDELDPRQVAAFEAIFERGAAADREAVKRIYGSLPAWLPAPVLRQINQALDTLRDACQSPERIRVLVEAARRDEYDVPGSALDTMDFIKSVNYLAHVQWALEQDTARALMELAGSDAATGRRLRDQRRIFSKSGNAAKKQMAAQKAQNWLAIGRSLRAAHPDASDRWLADQIARQTGDKASTIRAALKKLGLAKRKRLARLRF